MAVVLTGTVIGALLLPRWLQRLPRPGGQLPGALRWTVRALVWTAYFAVFVLACLILALFAVYFAFLLSGGRI